MTNKRIKYADYVLTACDQDYRSEALVVSDTPLLDRVEFQLTFNLELNMKLLKYQADAFAETVLSIQGNKQRFLSDAGLRGNSNAASEIAKTYIYSYYKAVFYALASKQGVKDFSLNPMTNRVFYGHALLYECLRNPRIISMTNSGKTKVIRNLVVSEDFERSFEDFEFKRIFISKVYGQVFNSKAEDILEALVRYYPGVKVESLGSLSIFFDAYTNQIPLGNMAYVNSNEDAIGIAYLRINNLEWDLHSRYWTLANNISFIGYETEGHELDVYRQTFKQPDLKIYGYMSESVTGLDSWGGNSYLSDEGGFSPNPDSPSGGEDPSGQDKYNYDYEPTGGYNNNGEIGDSPKPKRIKSKGKKNYEGVSSFVHDKKTFIKNQLKRLNKEGSIIISNVTRSILNEELKRTGGVAFNYLHDSFINRVTNRVQYEVQHEPGVTRRDVENIVALEYSKKFSNGKFSADTYGLKTGPVSVSHTEGKVEFLEDRRR